MKTHSLEATLRTSTSIIDDYPHRLPLSTEQYEQTKDISRLGSQDFKEGGYASLRDFFHNTEHAKNHIKRTIQCVSEMRKLIERNHYEALSFAHDDEGTISLIYNYRLHANSDGTSYPAVDIARLNPLNTTENKSETEAFNPEKFEAVPFNYHEDGSATASIRLSAGDRLCYHLNSHGQASYVMRHYAQGSSESSLLYCVRNLDYELAYDHPSDPRKITERLAREALTYARAYHGL